VDIWILSRDEILPVSKNNASGPIHSFEKKHKKTCFPAAYGTASALQGVLDFTLRHVILMVPKILVR